MTGVQTCALPISGSGDAKAHHPADAPGNKTDAGAQADPQAGHPAGSGYAKAHRTADAEATRGEADYAAHTDAGAQANPQAGHAAGSGYAKAHHPADAPGNKTNAHAGRADAQAGA